MKKVNWKLFAAFLAGLALMAGASRAVMDIFGLLPPERSHWLLGIGAGVALCLLAVLCHLLAKGRTAGYLAAYGLNALGSGCAIGTLYAHMHWIPTWPGLAMGMLSAGVLGLVLCLGYLAQGRRWRKVWGICVLVLDVAWIGVSIPVWIGMDRVLGSFSFFCGVSFLFFLLAWLAALEKPRKPWRDLSFSGFWAFGVIALVAVIILSEGDVLDGFDFGDAPTKKKKNRLK